MSYNVRINDNFLRGDHVDGEILQHTDLNELEDVAKTAINANYEDIQKLQDGTLTVGNAINFNGSILSTLAEETLQNSDAKVPTSSQVKQYVDGQISNIDLDGYYTKRETDTLLEGYVKPTDYASAQKGGTIKLGQYGATRDGDGFISLNSYSAADYQNLTNSFFISKGTLANLLTSNNFETANNKVTSISSSSTNTEYPSAKCIYDNYYKKTDLATVATSGSYNDLIGKPTIPTVNNATLTIQKNGATIDTFTANSSTNKTVNVTVPTKTSDLTNDSGYITNSALPDLTDYVKNTDYAKNQTAGVIKTGNGIATDTYGILTPEVRNYTQYQTSGNTLFISKGTLDNVLTATIGDIATALDAINGEVI